MASFIEATRERFGPEAAERIRRVLESMDLPDARQDEYLRGTEGNALFINRYGLILSISSAMESPEHDLILKPLRPPQIFKTPAGEDVAITFLPGVEGVLHSASHVFLLKDLLALEGIDFFDIQGSKGVKNGGYIHANIEGLDEEVPLVIDRGGVRSIDGGPAAISETSLAHSFNRERLRGIQERHFEPFCASLKAAWPEDEMMPSHDGMHDFLDLCRTEMGRGRKSRLSNQWAKNFAKTGMAFVDKPIDVRDAATRYERHLKMHGLMSKLSFLNSYRGLQAA